MTQTWMGGDHLLKRLGNLKRGGYKILAAVEKSTHG